MYIVQSKFEKQKSFFNVPTSHANPASTGFVVSSMSLPYKQRPASIRNESRAPNPASSTFPSLLPSKCSTMWRERSAGMDISQPSSPLEMRKLFKKTNTNRHRIVLPVYPHLVIRQSDTPTNSVVIVCIK